MDGCFLFLNQLWWWFRGKGLQLISLMHTLSSTQCRAIQPKSAPIPSPETFVKDYTAVQHYDC